jgi:hypothetical protein
MKLQNDLDILLCVIGISREEVDRGLDVYSDRVSTDGEKESSHDRSAFIVLECAGDGGEVGLCNSFD